MTEKVQVYYNSRKQCWSVFSLKERRVVDHVEHIVLKDVRFIVREGGRNKVRKTGQKNVHAFLEGERIDAVRIDGMQQVIYNPFVHEQFTLKGEPNTHIYKADYAWMTAKLGATYVFVTGTMEVGRELKLLTHEEIEEMLVA